MAKKVFYGFILAAAVIAAIGCEQSTKSSSSGTKGTGRLTLNIGVIGAPKNLSEGPSFTVFPGTALITKYTVALSGAATRSADTTTGSIEFLDLATGAYTITVTGFAGSNEVAVGSAEVTVTADTNIPVTVTIGPKTGTGMATGNFKYTITAPATATGTLYIYQTDGVTPVAGLTQPYTLTGGATAATATIPLAPGFYEVRAVLSLGQKTAGLSEVVHIYSALTSELAKTFAEADFADARMITDKNLTALVTKPSTGATPSSGFETDASRHYSGTVAWKTGGNPHTGNFAAAATYLAEVTLTADVGWTFAGVGVNSFSHDNAINGGVTNLAGEGGTIVVSITFPQTEAAPQTPQGGLSVTIGFGGDDIDVGGEETNIIYKSGTPSQLVLTTSTGYTLERWVVDGTVIFETSTLTLTAAAYTLGPHTVTFIGSKGGQYYSKVIPFTVSETAPEFVAVTGITGVPATGTVGTPISLSGATVTPANATNKTISWAVKTAGAGLTAGAIAGTSVTPTAAGTVTLTATVANGKTNGTEDFTKDFPITVTAASGPPSGGGDLEYSGVLNAGVSHSATSATAWALSVEEKPEVVFAVNNVSGTLTPGGTAEDRVTVETSGTHAGETATASRPIVKVNTKDMLFGDSPAKTFTLADGGTTVTVTVDVEPNLTGVAVFKVTADTTPLIAGDEELERLDAKKLTLAASGPGEFDEEVSADNLLSAIAWIDMNAEDNTDYLVRVESSESTPRIMLSCLRKTGVKVRLRGLGDTPKEITWDSSGGNKAYYNNNSTSGYGSSTSGNHGFIHVGANNVTAGSITLQLEKNITLTNFTGNTSAYDLINIDKNHTLNMMSGSKITNSNVSSSSIIKGNSGTQGYTAKVNMYAGSEISGNTVPASKGVVYFTDDRYGPHFFKAVGAEIVNNTDSEGTSCNLIVFWTVSEFGYDVTNSEVEYNLPLYNLPLQE